MKSFISTLFTLFILSGINAQTQDSLVTIADNIVREATQLYKSEKASWYGTDLFLEKYKDKADKAAGYFSYSENDIDRCIFFSKGETPKVLATIEFKGVYAVEKAKSDGNERDFTDLERALYTIRTETLRQIQNDTFVKTFKNANLNLIPIVDGKLRKVYIITGPEKSGVVLIGNDYVFTFDENNKFVKRQKLHNSLLTLEYSNDKPAIGAMHTHLPQLGEYMNVTDVCTLMLYGKTAGWQQHFVMSEHFVSIWNGDTNKLLILTKEAWELINKSDEKKRKKKSKN